MATDVEAIRVLSAQKSPLLAKLPAELRNTIYELVLVCETEIEIDYVDIHKRTGLLRTSSQLREEASRVFFGNNIFGISDMVEQAEDIKRFMESAQASPTDQLGVLSIHFNAPEEWPRIFRRLRQACCDGLSMSEAVTKVTNMMGYPQVTQLPLVLKVILRKHHDSIDEVANMLSKSRLSPHAVRIRDFGKGDSGEPDKNLEERAEKQTVWVLSNHFKNIVEEFSPKVAIQV